MFDRIIVGIDASQRDGDVLTLAEALLAPGGTMIIVCVHDFQSLSARIDPTEPSIDQGLAEAQLATLADTIAPTLTATTRAVAAASPAAAIRRLARSEQAELIVVGSSHEGSIRRLLIGSVAQQLLHDAPCSIAIASVGLGSQAPLSLRRITVGLDVREPVAATLPLAVTLCEPGRCQLCLMAVADDVPVAVLAGPEVPYMPSREVRMQIARETADNALATLPSQIAASIDVRDGEPSEILVELSRESDLLVLGSHKRGGFEQMIMGSVADLVIRGAACPVLLVVSPFGA